MTSLRYGACMAESSEDIGNAYGFSVEEDDNGTFHWRAFGPAGTREGSAASRAAAESAAQAAERELNDPSQIPPR
jgi:hypothetical protein